MVNYRNRRNFTVMDLVCRVQQRIQMTFLEIFKLFFSKEFVEDMSDQDQPLCRTIHRIKVRVGTWTEFVLYLGCLC